jgi:hypothetical protein
LTTDLLGLAVRARVAFDGDAYGLVLSIEREDFDTIVSTKKKNVLQKNERIKNVLKRIVIYPVAVGEEAATRHGDTSVGQQDGHIVVEP